MTVHQRGWHRYRRRTDNREVRVFLVISAALFVFLALWVATRPPPAHVPVLQTEDTRGRRYTGMLRECVERYGEGWCLEQYHADLKNDGSKP